MIRPITDNSTSTVDNNYSVPRHFNVHQRRHIVECSVFLLSVGRRQVTACDVTVTTYYYHAIIRRRGIGLYATRLPSLTTSAQAYFNVIEKLQL